MDAIAAARARIAAQRGELRGWRPLVFGDMAVVAVQVLGMVRNDPETVGLRVIVAGRTPHLIAERGAVVVERALRRRAVLAEHDVFVVVHHGEQHGGDGESDDALRWPWAPLVVHVPLRQLPAIAGLATNTVPRA